MPAFWTHDDTGKVAPVSREVATSINQQALNLHAISCYAMDIQDWQLYLWIWDILYGVKPLPGSDYFIDVTED